MRGPQRNRRPVVQHRDQLSLLLASGVLEETRVIPSRVVDVSACQRQVLEDKHARGIREPVELIGQHTGEDPQCIDVGGLRDLDIALEAFRRELVEPLRWCVARTAKKHWPSVYREAPATRTNLPRELAKRKRVLDASRLRSGRRARDNLSPVKRLLSQTPRFPTSRTRERELQRDRLLGACGKPHLPAQAQRVTPRGRNH